MMVRWYQVGAFSPFFRAHGHIGKLQGIFSLLTRPLTCLSPSDTKRREPYLFDQPYQSYIRDSIRLRYTLLPTLYTAFYEASIDGTPILRCARLCLSIPSLLLTLFASQASIRRLPR